MWHEENGSKGSSETATCLQQWILKLSETVEHVIFYSNIAACQNRNQFILVKYLHTVCHSNVRISDQKFMESGHSQMEIDSVHSRIERDTRGVPI